MILAATGFRFSTFDALFLVGVGLTGSATWHEPAELGRPLLLVVAHFFLFCNVVRLRGWREVLWSLCFLINVGVYWSFRPGALPVDWLVVSLTTLPITAAIVLSEITSPSYRGVFAKGRRAT